MNPQNVLFTADSSGSIDWSEVSTAYTSGITAIPTNTPRSNTSILEKTGDFLTGIPKWTTLAGGSAVIGLINTIPLVANAVGGKGTMEYLSTLKFAQALDESFAAGRPMEEFYNNHSEGVELTGAIAGSIVPGTLAVKGAKIAGSGLTPFVSKMAAIESDHIIGRSAAWLGGTLETSAKTRILRNSYEALAQGANNITSMMPLDRFRFAVAGGVQLGAEAMIFEAASTLAQMNNPTYKDINDLSSFASHIATAGAFGGVLGGIISPFLWKSAKFLPSEAATVPTTLRETAQVVGEARQQVLAFSDFAEKLRSIPNGSKVVSLVDDFAVSKEALMASMKDFIEFFPPDRRATAVKTVEEWFTRRDSTIGNALAEEVAKLAKSSGRQSDIGEAFLRKVVRDSDGKLLLSGDEAAQILTGAKEISPVKISLSKTGGLVANSSIPLSPAVMQPYTDELLKTVPGKLYRSLTNELAQLRESARLQGINLKDKLSSLSAEGQELKKKVAELRKKINHQDFKVLKDLMDDPRMLNDAAAAYLKLSKKEFNALKAMVSVEDIRTVRQTYDMIARQFVDVPSATLGDIISHGAALKSLGGVVQADGKILSRDIVKEINSLTAPKSSLDAQLVWHFADKTIAPKSGNTLRYKLKDAASSFWDEDDFNPYRLAAAIDQEISLPITREEALIALTKSKLRLRKEGLNKGMSEVEARLYADLPLEENLNTWRATKGRENNFLERRNVSIHFEEEVALSEMELKALAGIRTEIFAKNLEVAEAAFDIAETLGLNIPQVVRAKLADFREFGMNGANPIDFANAGNAGLITNSSGRMLRLNTDVLQVGSFLNGLISKEQDKIVREMAPKIQRILRGTAKDAELDLLGVIHKKITGGGTKWYDLAELMPDSDTGTLTYVSREIVDLLRSDAEGALERVQSLISEGNPAHIFTVENANVADLLRTYSKLEGSYRKGSVDLMGAKGYNVTDTISGQLYFPPLDVRRSPYFVVVRDATDSAITGLPRHSFIHANSSQSLANKVRLIEQEMGDKVTVISKREAELDKLLQGEFEHAKTFYSYSIDSELHSKGVFSDVLPRAGEELLEEMQSHLKTKSAALTRHILTAGSGDFLSSLDRLSTSLDQFTKSTHGKAFGPGKRGVTPDNIYSQMQRSFLDIRPDENADGILGAAIGIQNRVIEWADSLFDAGRNLAIKTLAENPAHHEKWLKRVDDIVAEAKKIGVDFPEMNVPLLQEAQQRLGTGSVTRAITSSLNGISAMMTLGVELMNPLVQSISLPVTINSAIRQLLADAPPQVKTQIKSIGLSWKSARLLAQAGREFWGDVPQIARYQKELSGAVLSANERAALDAWKATPSGKFFVEMSELNLIPPSNRQFMIEVGEVTDLRDFSMGSLRKKLIKAAELATTGNRYAEMFQRYAALKVANGIAEVASITGTNKLNLLHAFAAQANGVFTAAQRPGLFQGAIGSSFGLYKSYAINLMQAMGRHIENRDYSALLSLAAVQGTIFGAASLPGADQLNQYILEQNKQDKRDLFTTAQIIMGEGPGNALLYGLPSMFLGANLYSRGDLRPNSIVGNPFDVASYAAAQQFTQAVGAVSRAFDKAANGAPVGSAILDAVAHQSLWRPAARVAEFALGKQTTGQGMVIQNVGEASSRFWGLNLAVRIAGARPYDEAVLSDAYYRQLQYRSAESAAMKGLNSAVRLALSQGAELDYDSLAEDYIKAGGNPRQFRKWIRQHQSRMSITEAERMKNSLIKSDNARFAQQLDIPSDDEF